jgi:hypothetical protein
MNARVHVDPAATRAYRVTCASSNTLQHGDREPSEAARASAIDAIVHALARGSDLRLDQTLAHL